MISPRSDNSLSEFQDALLESDRANHADFQSEVAQKSADIVLDRESLFLQQLARREQRSSILALERLHMHWPEQVDPHHLGDAARVIAIALVHLRLEESLCMPRFNAESYGGKWVTL
jgi:hypothetical protein